MYDTDVLVVGAGPSGLTLAGSLIKKGVPTTVVDRQAAGANTSRAAVVNARTLEVLDHLDVSRRLVKEGIQAPRFTIRDGRRILIPVDFSVLPTDYPYSLMVPQATTERLLLDRLTELGGAVIRPARSWARTHRMREAASSSVLSAISMVIAWTDIPAGSLPTASR